MKNTLILSILFLASCSESQANDAAFGLGQFISTAGLIILVIWIISKIFKTPKKDN